MRFNSLHKFALLAFTTVALAACGGGPSGTTGPIPPAPTPTPHASPLSAAGHVYDLDNGQPLAGATVVIATTLYTGATPPPGVPAATTAADGSYTLTPTTLGPNYVYVYAANHATLHQTLELNTVATTVRDLKVTTPTAAETAWLALINADRAAYGHGAGPLIFDESALEAGRYWAAFMATNGYYAHCIPYTACSGLATSNPPSYQPYDDNPSDRYAHFFGIDYPYENIGALYLGTFADDENQITSERNNCPGGIASGCPSSETTGHWINLVDPTRVWAGVGIANNGQTFNPIYGPNLNYFVQELVTP